MEENNNNNKSALNVQGGIEQPSSVRKDALESLRSRTAAMPDVSEITKGILSGDISMLSRAITLVESVRNDHQLRAQEIITACLPYAGKSLRIGITGVPGVGKSTFIEVLGNYIIMQGHKLAVLAIDPSSERTKGSILGDKTRMEKLAASPCAFIRPSPSAGSLGGVARKTRESIILCEAAGFDTIFVETVGVGQSETAVHSMVDFFLLLMLAGAGDELQGIKRGIMEMADAIAINKADGENISAATRAKAQYRNALHLFPMPVSGWEPQVVTCSSLTGDGIAGVWNMIGNYVEYTRNSGYFNNKKKDQDRHILMSGIEDRLREDFYRQPSIKKKISEIQNLLMEDKISAYNAVQALIDEYYKSMRGIK